jgi:hypothetical protein
VPWCKYFIPKIAASGISPDDPALNEHIMYAKCIRGHVLRDANDWIQCENLPEPDSTCWQEGGDTLFTLARRKKAESSTQSTPQVKPLSGSKSQANRS